VGEEETHQPFYHVPEQPATKPLDPICVPLETEISKQEKKNLRLGYFVVILELKALRDRRGVI
jgi:hypothetical protein